MRFRSNAHDAVVGERAASRMWFARWRPGCYRLRQRWWTMSEGGFEWETKRVGGLPLVNRFLERLRVGALFDKHVLSDSRAQVASSGCWRCSSGSWSWLA